VSDLTGKIAVITGGATGIGRATATLFVAAGAAVVIGDINDEGGAEIEAELTAAGGAAHYRHTDVSVADDVRALVDTAIERHGRIDILFNNAAALGPDVYSRDSNVVDVDLEVWDRTFDVNLKGIVYGCRFAIPHMIEQGKGAIVNTSTVDALRGMYAGRHAYAASKAGVNALTLYMATEYASSGIRVNAIAPGLVMSPIAVKNLSPEWLEISSRHRLLGRAAAPEDIAPLVRFLASDDASFITGQIIVIDGGTINHMANFPLEMAELQELNELRKAAGRTS
jgi:NAD(P)-dependent dehydrogenase (short-subunit alcohol dehydrogenase family)